MTSQQKTRNSPRTMAFIVIIALMTTGTGQAQVPPDIAAKLKELGPGVCVPETARLYKPLQQMPPYKGVTVMRDISFGPDPIWFWELISTQSFKIFRA